MEILQTILYVVIIIAAVLLILLVLAQSNQGSDLGLFGGSTDMVFGSQKGNILTRTTAILATVILAGSFFMGVMKVRFSKDKIEDLKKDTPTEEIKTSEDLEDLKISETETKEEALESNLETKTEQ